MAFFTYVKLDFLSSKVKHYYLSILVFICDYKVLILNSKEMMLSFNEEMESSS